MSRGPVQEVVQAKMHSKETISGPVRADAEEPKPTGRRLGRRLLKPAAWRDDFEQGGLAGWFSYPPFQDTAFDFTLTIGDFRQPGEYVAAPASGEVYRPPDAPRLEPTSNRHYLLRSHRPVSAGRQAIGVARHLDLIIDENSTLAFDLWIGQAQPAGRVICKLFGDDGATYRASLDHPGDGAWRAHRLACREFVGERNESPAAGLHVQAMAIVLELDRADPAAWCCIGLDNVAIDALQWLGMDERQPDVAEYRNWTIKFIERVYQPGERLKIEASCEQGLTSLQARLVAHPDGRLARTFDLEQLDEHSWRLDCENAFAETERLGPYTLQLIGADGEGCIGGESWRLWLLSRPDAEARALLFPRSLQGELRERGRRDDAAGRTWQGIRARAAEARGKLPPREAQIELYSGETLLPFLLNYFSLLRDGAHGAWLNALVAWVDGDEAAAGHAREAILRMTAWPGWTHPWFPRQGRRTYYLVGNTAALIALAYDLLRDQFNAEQQRQICDGLRRNAIEPAFAEYFVDNNIPNQTSNWISHVTGGSLLAVLATDPTLSDRRSIRAFAGLAEKWMAHLRATLLPDGSYGEGYWYQNFMTESSWPVFAMLENLFGVAELREKLHFDRSYLYLLYASIGGINLLDMGDSSDTRMDTSTQKESDLTRRNDAGQHGANMGNWAWLVARTRDGVLKWLYDRLPGNSWEDFIWTSADVAPTPPDDLPPSIYFPDKGHVIFRSGWEQDATIFSLHAGPFFNHNHYDQGHYRLASGGRNLASEGGKASYYSDPFYWSHFIQAAAHNVVLVDRDPSSQEPGDFANQTRAFKRHARMTQVFLGRPFGWATCDLRDVYRAELATHERLAFFIEPGYIVLHDRIDSGGAEHEYIWQLHPPGREGLSFNGQFFEIARGDARLELHLLQPSDYTHRIRATPTPINDFATFPDRKIEPRCVLQVAGKSHGRAGEFTALLLPSPDRSSETAVRGRVDERGRMLVRHRDGEDVIIPRAERAGEEGVDFDGPVLCMRKTGVGTALAMPIGTRLNLAGRFELNSNATIGLTLREEHGKQQWQFSASRTTRIRLVVRDRRMTRASSSGMTLNHNENSIEMIIDQGESSLAIECR